ncbi:phosphatidylinositol mannoside acyltransferase [Pseudonocardiaceae bacterium YIM PH 21723]|nr:phosphatidylinositol mannoside acyltransferase [Pseudonocardiaceae bacterium YIM PH 21723]
MTPPWVADLAYGTGWGAVRALPERWAHGLFRRGADRTARRNGPTAQALRRNLARVDPGADLDELTRLGLRSYARYWCEAFRLPGMDPARIHAKIDRVVTGVHHVDEAFARGRGVVFALTHSGNWDAAGVWLVGHSGRFTTVAQRLEPESVYRRFVRYRTGLGFEVLPLTGGAPVGPILQDRLRANRAVCLLADRDLGAGGLRVDFFGERTTLPAGPVLLAQSTGAALIPADCFFTEDGWGLHFQPPVTVQPGRRELLGAAQNLADRLAEGIAKHPVDWHMTQPLWPADR